MENFAKSNCKERDYKEWDNCTHFGKQFTTELIQEKHLTVQVSLYGITISKYIIQMK